MKQLTIFERSVDGRRAYRLPRIDVPATKPEDAIGAELLRELSPGLPEVSEPDLVRHYTKLSHRNFAVDLGMYPLGSCTMKYNPKINEDVASLTGFAATHPLQPPESCQGILALVYGLLESLCRITGMFWGTVQPFAGAHGELTGMKLFRRFFDSRQDEERRVILVPDSAHGTNPASAKIAGFVVQELKSDHRGMVDVEAVRPHLNDRLAGIMLTNPNTLGLFESSIEAIADLVHDAGGLLYYDGANLNAILGKCRPGDMGFDVVHVNVHKTFSTPHGGGGPGAGPVLVTEKLTPFLPTPDIVRKDGRFLLDRNRPQSIGRVSGFYGNIAVLVRAYAYLLTMGSEGLELASEMAVLNANYLMSRIRDLLEVPYEGPCKHEFVASARNLQARYGVTAKDVAKALLDYGIHAPTVYFPHIVHEALMIEPTETESRESVDELVDALADICRIAAGDPGFLQQAPHNAPVGRVDEVRAAREPHLRADLGNSARGQD